MQIARTLKCDRQPTEDESNERNADRLDTATGHLQALANDAKFLYQVDTQSNQFHLHKSVKALTRHREGVEQF
jgi:hypothetical protein